MLGSLITMNIVNTFSLMINSNKLLFHYLPNTQNLLTLCSIFNHISESSHLDYLKKFGLIIINILTPSPTQNAYSLECQRAYNYIIFFLCINYLAPATRGFICIMLVNMHDAGALSPRFVSFFSKVTCISSWI